MMHLSLQQAPYRDLPRAEEHDEVLLRGHGERGLAQIMSLLVVSRPPPQHRRSDERGGFDVRQLGGAPQRSQHLQRRRMLLGATQDSGQGHADEREVGTARVLLRDAQRALPPPHRLLEQRHGRFSERRPRHTLHDVDGELLHADG
ncbi:hypothetical protein CTI14_37565, partial [Methylobacterium radiotolerans]